mgnify:CR=1 FL=1
MVNNRKSKSKIVAMVGIGIASLILLYKISIFIRGVAIGFVLLSLIDISFLCYFIIILNKSRKGHKSSIINVSIVLALYIILTLTINLSVSPTVKMIISCIVLEILYILICGNIAKHIGNTKNYKNGFIWGALLGIIGIIVVAVMPYKEQGKTNNNSIEKIKELSILKDNEIITQEEFETKKKELLNKM